MGGKWGCGLICCLLALLVSGSVGAQGCGYPDETFNALFTRSSGGWTGGDGTYSMPLPDGRTFWMFGDTFLGTVNADRSRPFVTPMIRHSFVVQDGDQLTTLYQETPTGPTALLTPQESEWWYWPLDGTVQGDELIVFLTAMRQAEPGMWGFAYAGRIDAAFFRCPILA